MKKSNSFFFYKERVTYEKKTVTRLRKDDGQILTNSKEILGEIANVYEKLYTSTTKNITLGVLKDYIYNTAFLPRLTESQTALCDRDLTLKECSDALKYFKTNKSPGCDGLLIEFYRQFLDVIGHKLVETLNYAKDKEELSVSQKRGVITLLHKRGKDEELVKKLAPYISFEC